MRGKVILLLIISFLLSTSTLANAQFSLKPKQLPDCKTFLISEIGAFCRLTPPAEASWHASSVYYVSNLGLMANLNNKYSLGATSYVIMHPSDPDFRFGLKARGRRWLGSNKSINLAAGIIYYNQEHPYRSPAFTGDLTLSFKDLAVLEVLMEILPYEYYRYEYSESEKKYVRTGLVKGSDLVIYAGIKIGSTPGIIGHLVAAVAGGVFYIATRE